jgi:hypothetical protein
MTAKPVPEHISDERLAEWLAYEGDHSLRDAVAPSLLRVALTELQHRREAEASFRALVVECRNQINSIIEDGAATDWRMWRDDLDKALAASPSSPASGVRVKALEWGRDHIRDEWWANPPVPFTGPGYLVLADGRWCKRDGVRIWVLDQTGDVDAAKAAVQADYEARILSALGEHP